MSLRLIAKAAPLALLLLASCGDNTPVVDLSAPSFDNEAIFRLNVAEVKVVDDYVPPFGGTHVEHLFPTSPARAVGIWTTDRLQASGPRGVVEVHVGDASVVETKGQQYDRYDASVAVDIKLYDGVNTLPAAEAQASAKLTRNIPSDTSVTKREDVFAQMTRDVSATLDHTLDTQIRQHFGSYIVSVQTR